MIISINENAFENVVAAILAWPQSIKCILENKTYCPKYHNIVCNMTFWDPFTNMDKLYSRIDKQSSLRDKQSWDYLSVTQGINLYMG